MRRLLTIALAMMVLAPPTLAAAQSLGAPTNTDDAIPGSPARGATFAAKTCASCHAISAAGVSPRMDAPAFGVVARKYADYRLDWELEAIASVGHYAMPARAMTAMQIADVTAYIRTLYDNPHEDHRRH